MDTELPQDVLDVGAEGISRHAKMPSYIIFLHAPCQAAEYLSLPFTQRGKALIKAPGVTLR